MREKHLHFPNDEHLQVVDFFGSGPSQPLQTIGIF